MISADAIRGHIDLIVLSILREAPSYAYELSRIITATADGDYTIKQTTLYTALKRLESSGLLDSYDATSETGKPRTYYRITPAGQEHTAALATEWDATRRLIDRFTEGLIQR